MRLIRLSRGPALALVAAGLLLGACKSKNYPAPPIASNTRTAPPTDQGPTAAAPCPEPSVTLSANAASINRGQVSTLVWQAYNADSLRIEPEIGTVALAGNRQVQPQSSVTYTATATSRCGTQSGVARITVNDQPTQVATNDRPPQVINVAPPAPRGGGPRGGPPTPPATTPTDIAFGAGMQNILFDYDKAELRPDQMTQLQSDATWLKQHPAVRVIVEGHADERGNQEYNLALGVRRANSVVEYFVAQGVNESRIRTISYGKERPVCREESPDEACHQQNRRAAFTESR